MQAVPVTSRSQQPWRRAASRAPIRVGSHGLQRVPRFDLSFPERVHCFPLRSTHKRPLQSPGARRGRGRDQQLFTYHALLGPILRLHKLIPGSRVRHKQCAVPPRGCLRGRPNGRSHRYDFASRLAAAVARRGGQSRRLRWLSPPRRLRSLPALRSRRPANPSGARAVFPAPQQARGAKTSLLSFPLHAGEKTF